VVAILGDDKVEIDMKGLRSRVDLTELDALDGRGTPRLIAPPRPLPPQERPALDHPIRLDQNTCDLRGMRVDEAIDAVVTFVDRLAARGDRFGFVLHGHGTGALKQAVRTWAKDAPYVRTSRPASESEGGDAFTVLEL
jgi:DNA mismatch repair protein MutS2